MTRGFRLGRFAVGAFVGGAALAGCGDDGGGAPGVVTVRVSGEEASRSGYPVGSGDDVIAFVDGWTLEFERVLVSIVDFSLRTRDGADAGVVADPVVTDLHLGEPELWRFDDVPSRRWDDVRYVYGPPSAGSRVVGTVDPAAVARMTAEGLSLLVEGVASDGTEEVRFEYGFALDLVNARCENGVDETDGVVVPDNGVVDAELTVHLDHLFFDSYASDEPDMRFEPMAAAADGEGRVDLEALAAQPLADLRDRSGAPLGVVYDPGPLALPSNDLAAYVRAAATTTGHFNGEGHCDYEPQ